MNYTRVLHALGAQPQAAMTPVDLAVYLSLSRRQPLQQLLSNPPQKPAPSRSPMPEPLPKLAPPPPPHHASPEPRSCIRRDSGSGAKKRVVFADAKGLKLTAVRLFIREPAYPGLVMHPSLAAPQSPVSEKLQRPKFRPAFVQPSHDIKLFLARLKETHVQLESCSVSEYSLSGKVWALQLSGAENSVRVKVTFDSWRSHHDIPCTFLQQKRCGNVGVGIFTFDLSLPQNIDPMERVEFCVSYRPGPAAVSHWDDNRGQNYRLCLETDSPVQSDTTTAGRFYPNISMRRPGPAWPSHNVSLNVQNPILEQQCLQRTLSNRLKEEWNSLFLVK